MPLIHTVRGVGYMLDRRAMTLILRSRRTSGLHGYLRFDGGTPTVVFDRTNVAEAAYVAEATRYYQSSGPAAGIFRPTTGDSVFRTVFSLRRQAGRICCR